MKKTIFFACVVMIVFCLSGCSLFTEEDNMDLTKEEIESARHTMSENVSGSGVRVIETLQIYTIDGVEEQLVPLKVPLDTDQVTPELIMDKVLENIDETITVTEIEVEKARIYVRFSDASAPIQKCSKQYETLILDCISNSLLDNISYVDEVVFRGEKDAYHSSNYSFGDEEVYSYR